MCTRTCGALFSVICLLIAGGCDNSESAKSDKVTVHVDTPAGDVHVEAPKPHSHEHDTKIEVGHH